MSKLRVITGGKDTARNAQRQYARPHLQKWIAAGQLLARGEGVVKFRPAHIDLMNKLTNFPSANEFFCFASQQTLGEKMGISLRTARRLFSDLKHAKLIAPKRRGLGKTSIWVFCIDGIPLSTSKLAAQDRPEMAAQDRPPVADKPYEIESLECEPFRKSSSPPAPPPLQPRARETGEAVAADALASLSLSSRAHPGWRGLGAWVGSLLSDGAESVDVIVGISQCLRSLKDQPPSTFGYFSAAIERAREARLAPLPEVLRRDPAQHSLGAAGETLRKVLGNEMFSPWFGQANIVSTCGDTVTISVDTKFKRSRIMAEYEATCIAAFKELDPLITRLAVIVAKGVNDDVQ